MVSSSSFVRLFFILLISLLFVPIVSAETGQIQVADAFSSPAYTFTAVTTGSPNFNLLQVDSANYNKISEYYITGFNSGYFLKESNGTYFTISSGGTGGGYVSYNKYGLIMSWVFDNATITGGILTLTYEQDIFDSNNLYHVNEYYTTSYPSITKPVCVLRTTNQCMGKLYSSAEVSHYAIVSSVTTIEYNVTYPQPLKYSVDVNKTSGGVSTKILFENSTAIQWTETAFNTVGFTSPLLSYNDGLWINVTLSSGVYNDVLINSSGISGYTPSIPGTGGSPSGQISFDYSTAALTYPYGINVSILTANWSDWFSPTFRMKVVAPGDASTPSYTVSGFPIDFSLQTYSTSRLWDFRWVGTYNASLYNCGWAGSGCLLSDGILMDTATLTIAQTQYVYSVTSDANSYSTGDIIRFNISNPSPNPTYFNMVLKRGISGRTGEIYGLSIPANTNRYLNVTVTGDMVIGTWEGILTTLMSDGSAISGRVAVKEFTIGMPTAGFEVSVRWDSNFVQGETNNLYYTTNQNTSTVTVNKTLPGSNASFIFDIFTAYPSDTQPKPYLMDTVGQWIARITDNGNASNTSTATITVTGISGCNKNLPDYVCWDKVTYLRGDPYVINYKVTNIPVTINPFFVLRLLIYDPDDILVKNKTIAEYSLLSPAWELPLSGSSSGLVTSHAKVGKWHAVVMREGTIEQSYTDGSILADSYAIVVDTTTAIGGTNATSVPGTPRAIIDGWTALFGWGVNDVSRFFFALLFVTAGMFSGFMLSGKNLYGGVFGAFLPWAFFALPSVNYIPSWVTIFIAIIVALKIGWFK